MKNEEQREKVSAKQTNKEKKVNGNEVKKLINDTLYY